MLAIRAAIDGRLVATQPDEGLSTLRIDLRADRHRPVDGDESDLAAAFNRDGTLLAAVGATKSRCGRPRPADAWSG